MRVAAQVILSPEERSILARWAGGKSRGSKTVVRARIILWTARGWEDREIARELGLSRHTVALWRQRFLASRLRGLDERPAPPVRLGGISEEKVRAILRLTATGSPPSFRPWTTRSLARRYGVSHSTIQRIWRTHRVRPAGYEVRPLRPDPSAPQVPRDVVGIYLRPPDYAMALTLQPAAPEALSKRSPMEGAALAPVNFSSRPTSHEVSLRGMLTGLRPSRRLAQTERLRRENLLRFLGGVARQVGGESGVRVIALRPQSNADSTFDRWQLRHPHFQLETVPDFEGWKRRALDQARAAGRTSDSRQLPSRSRETTRSLTLSLASYGENGGPFEWIATPEEIRRGRGASRLRYDLAATGHTSFHDSGTVERRPTAPTDEDAKARAMARLVLRKCLAVGKGEQVTIESWTETLGYANAFVLESLRLGARPMLVYEDEATYWAAAQECRPEYLARLGDHRRAAIRRTDVLVSFFGPSDHERFHSLPDKTRDMLERNRESLYRAAAKARVRAVQMAVGRASASSARLYRVDLARWKHELLDSTLVEPAELYRRGRRIFELFFNGRRLEISHPNGTELHLRLARRKPEFSYGLIPRARHQGEWSLATLPAGVVSVALDESFAEGTFQSNVTCSVGLSHVVGEVSGGRWVFRHGRLDQFTYDEGRELFAEGYARAGPGRDRPGTISIGLNEHLSISPLLEDQGAGMVSLLIGRNDHVGGATHLSWWAWLFLRGGNVLVDGKFVVRDGRLYGRHSTRSSGG
ncbi:MAG: helix-turn-helix domain-containing protein [Thermoplasmata archaeon]